MYLFILFPFGLTTDATLHVSHHPDRTVARVSYTLFTLAPWPWPSEVLFTLGELNPRQTGQHRRDCLGEDISEGQV